MTRHASYKPRYRLVILSLDIWGIFTQGLTQTAVLRNQWASGVLYGLV